MNIVYIWPTWVAGGALYVHSPQAPPIVLPSTGVKADVVFEGLGFRVEGLAKLVI